MPKLNKKADLKLCKDRESPDSHCNDGVSDHVLVDNGLPLALRVWWLAVLGELQILYINIIVD
jgi:hypothetical protein